MCGRSTNPDNYNVTLDEVLYISGTWTNRDIPVNIDGLVVGFYGFVIYVYNNSGNMVSDKVLVTVVASDPKNTTTPNCVPSLALFIISMVIIRKYRK